MTNKNNNKKRKVTLPSNSSESDTAELPIGFDDLNNDQRALFVLIKNHTATMIEDLQRQIVTKDLIIENLHQDVSKLRKKVLLLEDRVEDNDAYDRRSTIVVSGSNLPVAVDGENATDTIAKLIKDKVGVVIGPSDISTCYRVGKKPETQTQDKRKFVVKFCREETKHDLIRTCKTVKPQKLYFNESLTQNRSAVLFALRQAKKKHPEKIASCCSYNGRVYAWMKPPNPSAPLAHNTRILVNSRDRFYELCEKTLNCRPDEFFNE